MRQTVHSQKGEIEFRKKLVQHQIEGNRIFQDEFDTEGIERILHNRMRQAAYQMTQLQERGIPLSPYIEIGAERCQRALVMENDLKVRGAAIDISFEMLKSCQYYAARFHKQHLPIRICCDANQLPFLSNSLPFVFCYETLHHFPEPGPIVKEIHRVLSPGGSWFFAEEPYKRVLHLNLYKAAKVNVQKLRPQPLLRHILDFFFADLNCNERDYGIIENHRLSLRTWRNALRLFAKKDVRLDSWRGASSELFHPTRYKRFLLTYLLGGDLSGICRKAGELQTIPYQTIYDALRCPSCAEKSQENVLIYQDSMCFCPTEHHRFPIINDVLFLFPEHQLIALYPEYFRQTTSHQ